MTLPKDICLDFKGEIFLMSVLRKYFCKRYEYNFLLEKFFMNSDWLISSL